MYLSAEIQMISFDVLHRRLVQKNWVTHREGQISINIQTLYSYALSSKYVFDMAVGICWLGWVKSFQSWQKVWFPSWGIRSRPRHNIPKLDAR